MLRLGYYKLERDKEKAEDWIWIVDHTVQLGHEKCLVILGIRQSRLPPVELYLDHEDVEPIALLPVQSSNGEVVYQQLTQAAEKTGVPRQIVADHGSDIKSGIERFCNENKHCCFTYDIKHKSASILKRELKDDEQWNEFIKLSATTRQRVCQTPLAALAPPNQRSKARYLNLDILVKWGQQKLVYFDLPKNEHDEIFDAQQVEDKLGWLKAYRDHLHQWQELIESVKTAEEYIKFVGIFDDCHIQLRDEVDFCATSPQAKRVWLELLVFIEQQSLKAKQNERLLGSSEVIESVFGKFKSLEQNQVKSGFTSLLLSLAATVSKTTKDTIEKAMKTVPTKKVRNWFEQIVGHKSVQAKRKLASDQIRKSEQKRDEIFDLC